MALPLRARGASRAESTSMPLETIELVRELKELIEALDRRVPRVELAGEPDIARDAAALRAKAVARLTALSGS